jgi:hypothetical protein
MKEWELQKSLYELLEENNYPVYADRQRPSEQWYPKIFDGESKRPDILFFHDKLMYCNSSNRCRLTPLPNPIGIELKIANSFSDITSGIIEQLDRRYKSTKYVCPSWRGSIPTLIFATDQSIINGHIDRYHTIRTNRQLETIDFVIERLLWRLGMGSLRKIGPLKTSDFLDDGNYKHCKVFGDFSSPKIALTFDNTLIELCRC